MAPSLVRVSFWEKRLYQIWSFLETAKDRIYYLLDPAKTLQGHEWLYSSQRDFQHVDQAQSLVCPADKLQAYVLAS